MKEFESLKISTQTVIADSGLTMEIDRCFGEIPVEIGEVVVVKEEESSSASDNGGGGKKKKKAKEVNEEPSIVNRDQVDWQEWIPKVRCRAMYYKNDLKLDPSFELKKRDRYFRNALNVVLSLDDKCINFKLSKNGKFQLTGCKFLWHAQASVIAFLLMIRKYCPGMIPMDSIRIAFQTVMTNMDFNIGHTINRQNLDVLINESTPYYSLLETSFGYTGVNVKFPIPEEWWKILEIPLVTMTWKDSDEYSEVVEEMVIYDTLLNTADRQRLSSAKKKFNTFLVFHSGNIIMSGMNPQLMKPDYQEFTGLLTGWTEKIREQLKQQSSSTKCLTV